MIERIGEDMWQYYTENGHLVCISTNGFRRKNGTAVMGRGCAKQATKVIRDAEKLLGQYIIHNGNVPGMMQTTEDEWGIGILPVKHNWWEKADMALIANSIVWLLENAEANTDVIYHVPRLGCGNGKLDWGKVKPMMLELPDNVWVHSL